MVNRRNPKTSWPDRMKVGKPNDGNGVTRPRRRKTADLANCYWLNTCGKEVGLAGASSAGKGILQHVRQVLYRLGPSWADSSFYVAQGIVVFCPVGFGP